MSIASFSQASIEDIKDILQYSEEEFGNRAAINYRIKINEAIQAILSMPTRGHKRQDLPSSFLSHNTGKHVIIYQFNKMENTVYVLRVLHQKMNFKNMF